jgi:hypothetical protein
MSGRLDSEGILASPNPANEGPSCAITEREAAVRLSLSVATLRAWRHQGRGPRYVRFGRAIRYVIEDLNSFVEASRVGPVEHTDR